MKWLIYFIVVLVLVSGAVALTYGPECNDPTFVFDCADLIVEGYPIDISGHVDSNNRVISNVKFEIVDVLKGDINGVVNVKQMGGEVGNKSTKVIGITVDYQIGERYELHLEKSKQGDYYLVCCGLRGAEKLDKEIYIGPSWVSHDEMIGKESNIFVRMWNWFLNLFRLR